MFVSRMASAPLEYLSTEDELKNVRRRRKETMEFYLIRFQVTAARLNVPATISTRILYSQLPPNLKLIVNPMDPETSLQAVIQRLQWSCYWTRGYAQCGWKAGGIVLTDSCRQEVEIVEFGVDYFAEISDLSTLESAVRTLYERGAKFRRFVMALCRSGREGREGFRDRGGEN